MLLRIGIDLRPLLDENESGVAVYTRSMLDIFMKKKNIVCDLFYQSAIESKKIQKLFPEARHIKISNTLFHIKSLYRFQKLPENYFIKKPDLIWLPDRRPFYISSIPLVMTIHDLVPENNPESLSLKSKIWFRIFSLNRLLELCNGVICPSYTTASALNYNLKKVVTYEGADLAKSEKQIAKVEKKTPFFLVISPADPRKRLDWVEKMAIEFPKANFVIAGLKNNESRFKRKRIKKLKNIIFLGQFSEPEKKWLLTHTLALLALSKNEGFDLPVLEAVKAKCPVIMSNISVHKELYKSPECIVSDLSDLRLAIYNAIKKRGKIPKPRCEYSWEKASEKALLFFRSIVVNENC